MNTVIKRAWNKNKLVKVEDLTGMTFQAESGGHTFEISGVDDTGAAVSLSGTVEGRFLRADNAEIIISGTASGGKVSVTLSEACYAIPGRFLLTIYVTSGGQKVAVYAATGSVVATSGTASGSIPPLVTDSVQTNSVQTGSLDASGNVTVGGVLDVTPRRCYAVQLQAGWHRVLTFAATSETYARGATGNEVVFHITRRTTNAGEETHEIKMLCAYDGIKFVDEVSSGTSGYQRIDKIRYNYNGSNGFVDIHAANAVAHVTVDFEVYCEPSYQSMYTASGLAPVDDSPAGETQITSYNFSASMPDAGYGYTKLPDGTLIQWGYVNGLSFSSQNLISGTASFPVAFVDANYIVQASAVTTGTNQYLLRCGAEPKDVGSFYWVLGSGDSSNITVSNRMFNWIAIGRWK